MSKPLTHVLKILFILLCAYLGFMIGFAISFGCNSDCASRGFGFYVSVVSGPIIGYLLAYRSKAILGRFGIDTSKSATKQQRIWFLLLLGALLIIWFYLGSDLPR